MANNRVLIVEDERPAAEMLKDYLSLKGFDCTIADGGRRGWELYEKSPFEAILLDLNMPDMDGLTLLKKIREVDEVTPVILLTATASPVDRVVGLEMGANDYLGKPCELVEVVARIRAVIRAQQSYHKQVLARSKLQVKENRPKEHAKAPKSAPAENLDDVRRAILSKMAHDLANYSQNIEQISELLLHNRLQVEDAVKAVRSYSILANMTIANIRYYVQGQPIKLTRLNARSVMFAVRDIFESTHRHLVSLKLEPGSGLDDPEVRTSREFLIGALLGLLDNAATHGQAPPPDSSVRAKRKKTPEIRFEMTLDRNSGRVVYSVEDHGRGIPSSMEKRLFFEPVTSQSGMGTGLYLTRQIATELDWEVDFERQRNRGTRFFLALIALGS